jgi:hypothetical protein
MKIVDKDGMNGHDHTADVIQLRKEEEKTEQLPISTILDHAAKADLSDVIVIGKRKDAEAGSVNLYMSASCSSGIITHLLLRQAMFHIEHSLFSTE